ncbi:hypothetical protein PAPYR_13012 [Paratrimastix pyriformis]|uniref:Uncharacterized protein n=1 Tax=Paratrimastix pyriformis TaxID=342808 RepID=A0ABQ8U0Y9_9EUKA|nr:hypothetical protein PAPYR_13012 [Paratrimastix pyriformis]
MLPDRAPSLRALVSKPIGRGDSRTILLRSIGIQQSPTTGFHVRLSDPAARKACIWGPSGPDLPISKIQILNFGQVYARSDRAYDRAYDRA